MGVYTISPCIFQGEYKECMKILSSFITLDSLKIAIDLKGYATEAYKSLTGDKYDFFKLIEIILNCHKYENINTGEISNIAYLFFEICKNTVGQHDIIVNSKQQYAHLNYIDTNIVDYEGVHIHLYTTNEAINKFTNPIMVNVGQVNNSVFTAYGNINQ